MGERLKAREGCVRREPNGQVGQVIEKDSQRPKKEMEKYKEKG